MSFLRDQAVHTNGSGHSTKEGQCFVECIVNRSEDNDLQ